MGRMAVLMQLTSVEPIREAYHRYLRYFLSKDDSTATSHDRFMALAYAVRSEMVDRWIRTQNLYHSNKIRRVYYLSPEYILGKSLHQNVISLGLLDDVKLTAEELGFTLEEVLEKEDDLELGNGAKARQAASIQEAMASLALPGMGYGLRYDYGLFRQKISNGWQMESPYDWQNREHPWEIPRPEYECIVKIGGRTEPKGTALKTAPHIWRDTLDVIALPTDIPIPGYGCQTVNTLRLWSSRASEEFPAEYVRHGDYVKACEDMAEAGRITRVLHPESDVLRSTPGRIRLQYFLVNTSLQDIVRRYRADNATLDGFEEQVVIHLSGSNCALAIPELMRLLVDVEEIPWERAWEITSRVFTYSSSAVAYERMETWPVYVLEQMLPRHMEIIYEINQQHIDRSRELGSGEPDAIREVSTIEEGDVKRVKLSHIALLASTSLTGSSTSQVEKLRTRVFPRMLRVTQKPVHRIANGVSHRRWLLGQNEPLSALVTEAIGEGWIRQPEELSRLEPLASDTGFLDRLQEVKLLGKRRLLSYLRHALGFDYDEHALFDVQFTRIHPHKRQVLHALGIAARYLRLKAGEQMRQPQLHIFAGKAMPSDFLAKQTIKLIHEIAAAINSDSEAKGKLHVLFVPDYGLTWADRIVPGVELAECLSTPGFEAYPTTPLKAVFGAGVTMIARGGAGDDFIERVGEENVFAFGSGEWPNDDSYRPWETIAAEPLLQQSLVWIEKLCNSRSSGEDIFPLISSIRDSDRFHAVADFRDYVGIHERASRAYADRRAWFSMAARALSRAHTLSTDTSTSEYARTIWKLEPTGL